MQLMIRKPAIDLFCLLCGKSLLAHYLCFLMSMVTTSFCQEVFVMLKRVVEPV
jgi:hypothetical protein